MLSKKASSLFLVDDDPALRGMLGFSLEMAGYQVVEAESRAKAILCLQSQSIPVVLFNPDPGLPDGPPYFHLATPPFGALSGDYNLLIYPQSATPYDSSAGFPFGGDGGNGTVAIVISWGANGDQVYRYNNSRHSTGCDSSATATEFENCDDDRVFVDTKTGEARDFITWISVNQAKMALIYNGEFR